MCGIWAILGADSMCDEYEYEFMKIVGRGPDLTVLTKAARRLWFGFHRLAIVEPADSKVGSAQPISYFSGGAGAADELFLSVICNGEIYNHCALKAHSALATAGGGRLVNDDSDCAAILHAFRSAGGDLPAACRALDGVFAFLLTDGRFLYVARDPLGVRPLFYGLTSKGHILFGSEVKCIEKLCERVHFFPPGCCAHLALGNNPRHLSPLHIDQYYSVPVDIDRSMSAFEAQSVVRRLLIDAVQKRLMGDRLFGFMLSGGLDSSLIASIATRFLASAVADGSTPTKPIAFSVGFEDSPDLENARRVADYLHIPHRVLVITPQNCIDAIAEVVYALETFDPLLIRCGVAHYLLCKHIARTSDVKVLLSGEGADELFGSYAYMQRAPTHAHLHREIQRRMHHLHQYDVLRCDRATSCHGLEIRVPFLDKAFIDFVARMPPSYKLAAGRLEKHVLRSAFRGWLPDEVLWRCKEGFSEALGKVDLGDVLLAHAARVVSDGEFATRAARFPWRTPQSKEEYWYRALFERRFAAHKLDGCVHTKVYRTADWHLSAIGDSASSPSPAPPTVIVEEKENIAAVATSALAAVAAVNHRGDDDEDTLLPFVVNFSKEESEIRFRRRSTGSAKLTGVA